MYYKDLRRISGSECVRICPFEHLSVHKLKLGWTLLYLPLLLLRTCHSIRKLRVLCLRANTIRRNKTDSTTNKMHLFLKLFIPVKHSTCFGRSFRPSSGAQNCTYSNGSCQTAAAICCYQQVAAAVWHVTLLYTQFWAPEHLNFLYVQSVISCYMIR